MASLKRKKSGIYVLTWTERGRLPQQISESLKTNDHGRATSLKTRLEYERHEGTHDPWVRKWYERHLPDNNELTIRQALDKYIDYKKDLRGSKGWKYQTYKQNSNLLNRFCDSAGPGRMISSLDERDLKDFYYRPGKRSEHTTLFERRIVRSFCKWCHDKGYIESYIDMDVDKPQEEIPEYFHLEQLQQIYRIKEQRIIDTAKFSAKGDTAWMIDAWKLAAATGMRKSEVSNLTVEACTNDFIKVGYSRRTKSNRQRVIPLLFEAQEIIPRYLDPDYRKADRYLSKSNYLFGRSGNRLGDRISREFISICRELWPSRTELNFHSLRHTFAVRYLTAPSNGEATDYRMYRLQRLLGHADRSTTEIYLKAIPYDLKL